MANTLALVTDATMALAAERGWRRLGLGAVAARAGIPLREIYALCPSKAALLEAALARIDQAMLAEDSAFDGVPPRDRLIEAALRRFEAMRSWREGIAAIVADLGRDPAGLVVLLPAFARSVAWTLRAAQVPENGLKGLIRGQAFGLAYLATLRTWLNDESDGLAATMAALDRNLRLAESALRLSPARDWGDAAPVASAKATAPPRSSRRPKGKAKRTK